jgi:cell division protein FtsB
MRQLDAKKIITIIIITGAVAFLVLNKGFRDFVTRKIQEHKLRGELKDITDENQRLKHEIDRLQHDERHIEYRIRRDLGYIKKGEVEYRKKQ